MPTTCRAVSMQGTQSSAFSPAHPRYIPKLVQHADRQMRLI